MASLRFMGLAVAFVGAIGLYNSMFTVDQTQQALVLQLGDQNAPFKSRACHLRCRLFKMSPITKSGVKLIPQDAEEVILSIRSA